MFRNRVLLKRSLQVLGIGSVAAALSLYRTDISPSFLLRHGRTVAVVARIVLDYHFTLKTLHQDSATDNIETKLLSNRTLSLTDEIKSKLHLRSAQSLLKLFKDNGGVYIKLGQHISSLVYLIPVEYTSVMAELQDHCPFCSLQDVERVFREEMEGLEMKNVFDWIII
jgi:aarF domain-containing kinase